MRKYFRSFAALVSLTLLSTFVACQRGADITPTPAPTAVTRSNEGDESLALVNEFLASPEFRSTGLGERYTVDAQLSRVIDNPKDPSQHMIGVLLKKDGKVFGTVEAVKKTSTALQLPNGSTYFMLLRDVSHFDPETGTGRIQLHDLNYDGYVFEDLTYEQSTCVAAQSPTLPDATREKYAELIEQNAAVLQAGRKMPCDSNGDGDVGFSECYHCFNSACGGSPNCYTLCYGIGDVIGWVSPSPGFPMCQASIGLACIWIAGHY